MNTRLVLNSTDYLNSTPSWPEHWPNTSPPSGPNTDRNGRRPTRVTPVVMPRFTRPKASLLLLVLLLLSDHAEAAAKQRNPYTVLGIKPESTAKEIKKAYRKMALQVRTLQVIPALCGRHCTLSVRGCGALSTCMCRATHAVRRFTPSPPDLFSPTPLHCCRNLEYNSTIQTGRAPNLRSRSAPISLSKSRKRTTY